MPDDSADALARTAASSDPGDPQSSAALSRASSTKPMTQSVGSRDRPSVVVIVVAGLAVLFLALPLIGLFGRVSWGNLWSDLSSHQALEATRLSLLCSIGSALCCVILGLPLGWVLARVSFPGRSLVRGLVMIPLVLPPVVGGVALLSAFSRQAAVGRFLDQYLGVQLTFSTAGAAMAGTFVALPFFVISAEAGLRAVDGHLEDAAASLGAGRLTVARRVTLPASAPAITAGIALAWARALGEFGATITFAGNIEGRTQTLPLAIYQQLDTNPGAALAMSLVLLVVSFAVIVGLREHWLGGLSRRNR